MEKLLTETACEARAKQRAFWGNVHIQGDKNPPIHINRSRGDVMRVRRGSPTFTRIGAPADIFE